MGRAGRRARLPELCFISSGLLAPRLEDRDTLSSVSREKVGDGCHARAWGSRGIREQWGRMAVQVEGLPLPTRNGP